MNKSTAQPKKMSAPSKDELELKKEVKKGGSSPKKDSRKRDLSNHNAAEDLRDKNQKHLPRDNA